MERFASCELVVGQSFQFKGLLRVSESVAIRGTFTGDLLRGGARIIDGSMESVAEDTSVAQFSYELVFI